jgi:hypothetical protein
MKIYVMSFAEPCGASTAHGACVHYRNASPCPSKCEFEVMPSNDRQCRGDFRI